jgi:membrane protein
MAIEGSPAERRHGQGGSGGGSRPAELARRHPLPAFLAAVGLAWLAIASRRDGDGRPAPATAPGRRPRPQPARRQLRQDDHRAAGARAGGAGSRYPGGTADSPTRIPPRGWWEVLLRVKDEIGKDNMSIIAAGCGFYALLALFPGISALVAIYGLVADPAQIEQQLASLQGVVPDQAFAIIRDQVRNVAAAGPTALGWGAALAIVLALYSASAGHEEPLRGAQHRL